MSSNTITIKPNNHRVYQCSNSKKAQLLNQLIEQNLKSNTVVVCSQNPHAIKELLQNKDIVVMDDKEFITSKDIECEVLISYDIPDKAIIYTARVSKATSKAFALVDKSEQKKLYPIEMLLGRAIKQEILSGFEYEEKKEYDTMKSKTMQLHLQVTQAQTQPKIEKEIAY